MADFDPFLEVVLTPTVVKHVIIQLKDTLDEHGASVQSAQYRLELLDQNGNIMDPRRGDITAHLDPGDGAWLLDFMTRMRAKAEAALPSP